MIKTRISRFKITKLFGYQDVDIDFNDRYKILIGENGLGKTTILNALYFLLDKKFRKLNNLKFESIELIFSNKSKISFTKNDLNFYINGRSQNQESHFFQILKDKIKKDDVEIMKKIILNKNEDVHKRLEVTQYLKKINLNIGAPSKFIYENINKFISEFEAINFQTVIDTLDNNITSKILYFPTYRRIESHFENLNPQQVSQQSILLWGDEDHKDNSNFDDNLKFGMQDVKARIEYLTEEIREMSLKGFSKITGDLLSQLSNEFKNYKLKNKFDQKKLQIILDRVGHSINNNDKQNIKDYIHSGNKSNKGLLYLIDKLIDLYNQQETLDVAIKKFADTCNMYLNLKRFIYDESSISLKIQRDSSTDEIELEQLSSGEKQIVSLFSKIHLELDKSFIILFDEPELSLSIYWQQRLLTDILDSNKCNFLLTVTHSPFIYDNDMQNYAYGLTDYIKFD
ncbi:MULTISPECIES: AAA family ATPase [Sphingobacterium]|uniref:AAA family ATPase n=1 Tax=Sphingobacterium TaxID=28453 RepID=UPI00104E1B3D|nr:MULTISPECIES: AAA family ATPase [Sphingobacterium]MCW2259612.1 putative ATPase [Sphingobacterium kitahiroshimense]TCR13945.1 AAA ATPase-like protein [Sphingobacterium sp. JUb78]